MVFQEVLYEKKLHIHTTGRDDTYSDEHKFPYEPTDYPVLERLSDSGYISKENRLVDYGCGKGRVSLFLHHSTGCRCIGIECVEEFFQHAKKNAALYLSGGKETDYDQAILDITQRGNEAPLLFYKEYAERFKLPEDVDRFFFFNPFSLQIMRSVMQRILDSYYEHPRHMLLFFYFPQDEYVVYLMGIEELEFLDEIDCTDLFEEKSKRNRILIFEMVAQ